MRDGSAQAGSGSTRLAVGLLIALTLLVHGRNVVHDFLDWDDNTLLFTNPLLNPVSFGHLGRIWSEPVEGLYTPMAYTVWSAVAAVARVDTPDADGVTLNPMAFHLLNVLLHAACVLIVFDVLLRLPFPLGEGQRRQSLRRGEGQGAQPLQSIRKAAHIAPHPNPLPEGEGTKTIRPAFIGAAVFAVHPLQVEAVAWISGMNNVLAGVFSLACIAAYLRFVQGGRKGWFAIAIVSLLLALFSKPTALVTPLVIVVIDALILRRPWRKMWDGAVLLAVAVPFVIVGRMVQPAQETLAPPIFQRLIVAGDAIGFYLCKLVWPWPLLIDYGRSPAAVTTAPPVISHWAAIVLTGGIVAVLWKRHRYFAGAVTAFVAGISLVIGLVPFDFQVFSTVADRYVYLGMLGVAMAVAFTVSAVPRRTMYGVAVFVLAAIGWLSFRQARLWADDETLARYTIARNPTSLAAHMILAYNAEHRGDLAAAEAMYRDGLATFPSDGGLNRQLGNLLFKSQRAGEAIPFLQQAFLHARYDPKLLNNLGSALLDTGHVLEAIDAFTLVTKRSPDHLNAYINLGHAYLMLNQFDQAEPPLRRALQIDPNSASAKQWMAVLIDGRSRSRARQ